MLDYESISALAQVLETQSFQKAADKLCISQSAISQRIKGLENDYGEPILIRTHPYRATALGVLLLSHYERVRLLESAIQEELTTNAAQQPFSIAISRDSLEIWFEPVIEQLQILFPNTLLKIIADDQELTLNYLKNGLVSACASSVQHPVSVGKTDFLGYLDYVLVATQEFYQKFFAEKQPQDAFAVAPTILFDHQDHLHAQYLEKFFNLAHLDFPFHKVPSVAGFKQFVCRGYAYALIPKLDVMQELQQGKLVHLYQDKVWEMPIYWHTWAIETKNYAAMNKTIIQTARSLLRQY
ncbi:MAG: ArgP/LysG family DNA-binding transcriptional regulator [Gammaproteobacteria bacterium]